MTEALVLTEFRPVALHIDRIGPFQESVQTIDFTDSDAEPCSFFLLLSRNGRGKTTILEVMTHLLGTLAHDRDVGLPQIFRDNPSGRVQLDIRITVTWSLGARESVLLSLMCGIPSASSLEHWDGDALARIGAKAWDRHATSPSWSGRFSEDESRNDDGIVPHLQALVRGARDRPPVGFGADDPAFLNPETAPVLLYFPSNRDIVMLPADEPRTIGRPTAWNYNPVRRFEHEGQRWMSSPDNLLVWMAWLEDGRFERACRIINDVVFKGIPKSLKGIRKDPPEAIVVSEGNEHRLDQLSSGERSLVLLFLLIAAHMTRNTIVLIDEVDLHLHPEWERRVVYLLKALIRAHPGLTVIASSHSPEVLERFDVQVSEAPLLRKGGFIIERDFDNRDLED